MGALRLVPMAALLAVLAGTGCASRKAPVEAPGRPGAEPAEEAPAEQAPPPEPPKPVPLPASQAAEALEAHADNPEEVPEPRLRDLCRKPQTEGVDEASRLLEETFCTATLWFDGLFGDHNLQDVRSARSVSGRVELSNIYTEFDGNVPRARLRVRYDLPALDRRINIFLERDDREDVVTDRREGLALRSSIFGVDTEDRWLAGLGYSPPGRFTSKLDFRVGPKLGTAPSGFAQARYRQNVFIGDQSVWRFRETVFYDTRDGPGETTSADFDHVLRDDLVFRSGSVATIAKDTEGAFWRQAFLLYHRLARYQAVAAEAFVRGETSADVRLQEYGGRLIYRFPVPLHKPTLFLEVVGGYSWPREELYQTRDGSAMIGMSLELLFGRDPY